jgi:hypothetical protein
MFGCSDERYDPLSFVEDSPTAFIALAGKTLSEMELIAHIQQARVHGKMFSGANGIRMKVIGDQKSSSNSSSYGLFLAEDTPAQLVRGDLVGVITGDLQVTCSSNSSSAAGQQRVQRRGGGRHMRPSCYAWRAPSVELQEKKKRRGRKRTLQFQIAADRRCTVLSLANTSDEAYEGRSSRGCNLAAVSCCDLPQVLLVFATTTIRPGRELVLAYTPDHDEEECRLEDTVYVTFVAKNGEELYVRLVGPAHEVWTADEDRIEVLGAAERTAVCTAGGARLLGKGQGFDKRTVANELDQQCLMGPFALSQFLGNPVGAMFPVRAGAFEEEVQDLWYSPAQRALFTCAGTMLTLHALANADPDKTYVDGLAIWEEGEVARVATLADVMAL